MANSFSPMLTYLDDFDEAISFKEQFPHGFRIVYIEWTRPRAEGDTCIIKDKKGGIPLIDWECAMIGERRINFYEGKHFDDLHIDADGVESGKVIIYGK